MSLDEAINHLNEMLNNPNQKWSCEKCKEDHIQLLEWLLELKERRMFLISYKNIMK